MTSVIRPVFGRVLSGALIACVVLALAVSVVQGGLGLVVTIGPWVALVILVLWATYWNPRVVVDDGGVHMVNVFSSVDIPWPAIDAIDTRWALTIHTAYGTFTAWAAPAPGGIAASRQARRAHRDGVVDGSRAADLGSAVSGAAAEMVRSRWQELRDAGHLDDPRLEFDSAPVTWHWPVILGVPALIAVGALAAALA